MGLVMSLNLYVTVESPVSSSPCHPGGFPDDLKLPPRPRGPGCEDETGELLRKGLSQAISGLPKCKLKRELEENFQEYYLLFLRYCITFLILSVMAASICGSMSVYSPGLLFQCHWEISPQATMPLHTAAIVLVLTFRLHVMNTGAGCCMSCHDLVDHFVP